MTTLKRIAMLDTLRGLAILLMILFHIVVDLTEFYGYGIEYFTGPWYFEGKLSAVLFMAIAGASSLLNHRALRHGLQVLACGMLVTIATYWFDPEMFVRFGILHLIGFSILTAPLLLRVRKNLLPFLATGCFAGGWFAGRLTVDTSWLLPLGIMPDGFASMDYYPLLPWYGVFILGNWLGKIVDLTTRAANARVQEERDNPLAASGRRSLLIYMVHQPILLGLLSLLRMLQLL